MDAGAHFFKSDFQVHSPRDPNWVGNGAVSSAERERYADEFVTACRAKSIQAVAITDHHDVVFFKYIREAALRETDGSGKAIPAAERLIVFPGMELTLAVPCQALVLLDADFPVDLLPQVVQTLSVEQSPEDQAQHAATKRLEHIRTLRELYAELEKREFLRGRFIVFPHVGEGGNSTLLRAGFAQKYKDMPCVGGFLDGPITQLGKGNSDIVNGRNKDYGNKAIAVFQTSDNRNRDFSKLGEHVTWVKWATPTTEALRQACLARHSRISHTEPKLPSVQLTRIEVSNSKFLGPITLDFNPQYNALIGGRGTGKSSILEYVRWALCDQPPTSVDVSGTELVDFQRRRQILIEGTLLPLDAVVEVSFLINGVPHIVRRKASGELTLKIGETPFQMCTEQNVRELLPIRAYSQKQLSAVGTRLDELRRFVQASIQATLDALEGRLSDLCAQMRSTFDHVVLHKNLLAEIAALELEHKSASEQLDQVRSSLKGLSPEDQAIIARQGAYEMERRVIQVLEQEARSARESLAVANRELGRLPSPIDKGQAPENADLISSAHDAFNQWLTGVKGTIAEYLDAFAEPTDKKPLARLFSGVNEWRALRQAQQDLYNQAAERAAAHQHILKEIQELDTRLTEIAKKRASDLQQVDSLSEATGKFNELRNEFKSVLRERADLIQDQCDKLTTVSQSRLRATLQRAADTSPLAENLKQLLRGTNTRRDRIDQLMEIISVAQDPLETWHAVLEEFQKLAWLTVDDEATTQLPLLPLFDKAGFTAKEKYAVARRLEPDTWLDLLLFDLKDKPIFEYQVRENDFLPFEKASPGQQATALLSILLLQDGPPLLIDQPEDDLNMKIVSDIVETLWQAKTHRQVVFASHNANLVVNGDAELVICCDYRTSATESGGYIKLQGAIDVPAINKEIADVMEGGVEAFKLRQQKYGF